MTRSQKPHHDTPHMLGLQPKVRKSSSKLSITSSCDPQNFTNSTDSMTTQANFKLNFRAIGWSHTGAAFNFFLHRLNSFWWLSGLQFIKFPICFQKNGKIISGKLLPPPHKKRFIFPLWDNHRNKYFSLRMDPFCFCFFVCFLYELTQYYPILRWQFQLMIE